MPGGAEEIHLRASDGLCFQFRVLGRFENLGKTKVDAPVQHLIDDLRPVEELKLDSQPGMLCRKHADGALSRDVGGIGPRGDAELADLKALGQIDLAQEIRESFDHRLAVIQHKLAKYSRRHALPVKQPDAKNIFQMFQATGQRRLRHSKRCCGAAKVPVRRESLNQFELTNRVHDTFQLSALTQMVLDTVNPITYQPNRKTHPAIVGEHRWGLGWAGRQLH